METTRTTKQANRPRPKRLMTHVYLAAALCVFAVILNYRAGFDYRPRYFWTACIVIGGYGIIAGIICFVRGNLVAADKWALSMAMVICALAASGILVPSLVK